MLAVQLVEKVVEDVFQQQENRFTALAFLWSVIVIGKKRRSGEWEDDAISICDIIRCISIPLFHQDPIQCLFIFITSSVFSFLLQKQYFIGSLLFSSLQLVVYFLLLGPSPMTYWNIGKQFFNLVVWPDDPRQLIFELSMHLAFAVMALHVLVPIVTKILTLVRIDCLFLVLLLHPATTFYFFASHWTLSILSLWFSALLISIKYQKPTITVILGAVFFYIYMEIQPMYDS